MPDGHHFAPLRMAAATSGAEIFGKHLRLRMTFLADARERRPGLLADDIIIAAITFDALHYAGTISRDARDTDATSFHLFALRRSYRCISIVGREDGLIAAATMAKDESFPPLS
jgi:hypothetical protein